MTDQTALRTVWSVAYLNKIMVILRNAASLSSLSWHMRCKYFRHLITDITPLLFVAYGNTSSGVMFPLYLIVCVNLYLVGLVNCFNLEDNVYLGGATSYGLNSFKYFVQCDQ